MKRKRNLSPGFNITHSKLRRRWWVTLVADNYEVLSHTEQLNSREAAEENIAAQRDLAPGAPVTVHVDTSHG